MLLVLHHVHEYNLELYFPMPLAVFQTQHEVCWFFLPLVSRFKQLLQSLLSNKVSCSQLPGFFWKDKSSNGKLTCTALKCEVNKRILIASGNHLKLNIITVYQEHFSTHKTADSVPQVYQNYTNIVIPQTPTLQSNTF